MRNSNFYIDMILYIEYNARRLQVLVKVERAG